MTHTPYLDKPLRTEAEVELLRALKFLVARWEIFTGPCRSGWGNMSDAYYDLAKHAQKDWDRAREVVSKYDR